MITPKNIINHELIGLEVEVIDAKNLNYKGIKGMVVNETKNMLWIETKDGIKKVPKKGTKFMFTLSKHKVIVDGNRIAKRPEDRLKIKVSKWRK